MRTRSRKLKRELEQERTPSIKKKLRSKLPRRKRSRISPILHSSLHFTVSGNNAGFSGFSLDSSSCSYFGGEVSCYSSRVSVGSESKGRWNSKKKEFSEVESLDKDEYTEFLRSRKLNKLKETEVEVSELSCVESNSGVRLNVLDGKAIEFEHSEAISKSEISCSCAVQFSGGNSNSNAPNRKITSDVYENDVVSITSGVCDQKIGNLGEQTICCSENGAAEFEFSEVSLNQVDASCNESNAESTIKQWSENFGTESDLACAEQFSYEDALEYSSSQATVFSDLQSEIFAECSDIELSDYTPSLFFESGSEFSERSIDDATPSHTFSLFRQYNHEFSRSTSPIDHTRIALCVDDESPDNTEFMRFEEDIDEEESYQMLRTRERRQVYLCNYSKKYYSTTEHGELILQQRSQMVHWIVEQCSHKELRNETMFLGVSLLDRFLCKGYFIAKRNLQIVGIACLTLATRIEENQPYNSVRQKNFYIGGTLYKRCEVVAMEWMVQEVLNYQCFLPTIYNFLWFYLKAARADAVMEKRVMYLAVLALSAHEQLSYWPSTVAAAIVALASLKANQDALHRVIGTHVRSKDEHLHECIESLEWLLRYV
ncbi:cyclin-SDS [Quillaja saponaria]|uniref:B-like cyclin n=1 Tax=Quillaja saponaria TaxID=32244 RepID=A0AAD7P5K8_QUISA|nr:cyclin-SDS [Quillaja saponaria]